MICVSIGRGRHKHTAAEHLHLVEQGAELVELRLDYIVSKVNLKRALEHRDKSQVIVTVRRERDGGRWTEDEDARRVLLRAAIAEGVDYVDLEEDVAAEIPRFGRTKRIVSLHNFEHTPDNLEEIYARLTTLDADVVKIATMANSPDDNLRMLRLMKNADRPTVGICMGDMGTPTRILAGKFGAPFTYATFSSERSLAPGQLSFKQMKQIYDYDSINAETEVFGVIADPVGHSLSPLIHNVAFTQLGVNGVYVPFRVPREYLDSFLEKCPELDVRGLSVTIPHKEDVIRRLNKIDGSVRGIGAANTVVFKDGESLGFNTDYRAAMDSLDAVVSADGRQWDERTALVLGAGGVARALAFGLRRRGAQVVISGRTLERAEKLAAKIEGRAVPWESRHTISPDVIINGTPIGMHPHVDQSPLEKQHLRPSTVVFDTVYNPEQTMLLKLARERGCRVISGMEMFIRQAALQFQHFTGRDAPADAMREAVRREIGPTRD